ncbi:hypothetical protein AVEN_96144-1 [Araneus ventricosus]|uniref:Uncharacterized protein n=1 Tax=Araneus ventricosus TaxID=182803 RepID=A0A4Y2HSF5_ARAVE|nr:hypothetical protein AVEN_96144-1 [Araneus ventricosus]
MESSSTFKRISSANRDIENIPAPLSFYISSPRSGVHTWLLPVVSHLPLQKYLPNHKTHIAALFVTISSTEKDKNEYARYKWIAPIQFFRLWLRSQQGLFEAASIVDIKQRYFPLLYGNKECHPL